MQAIVTKYLGPTNTRGSRVKATAQAGSVTIEWQDDLNVDENHESAVKALKKKLGWDHLILFGSGELPDAKGRAYVLGRKQPWIRREGESQ